MGIFDHMNELAGLGVGGIFVVLVLRMVFEFVDKQKAKRNGTAGLPQCIARAEITPMIKLIEKISNNLDNNTRVQEQLLQGCERLNSLHDPVVLDMMRRAAKKTLRESD